MLSIGIIVAAIPEGLPASLTLSLAIAVQRLTQRGVLVKKLSTLETLGTVSVICTDKSGTLTQNQMTVRYVWTGGSEFRLDGVGYEPKGQYSPNPANSAQEKDLLALAHAALLCNNSRLVAPDAGHPVWTCLGDQTEAALSVAALKAGLNEVAVRDSFPRLHELPFDARRKRMSTVHRISPAAGNHSALGAGQTVAFIKGAPAEILNLCTHIQVEGQVHPLNNELRRLALAANDRYAHHALRVLALARKELPVRGGSFSVERVESGLTFLGLAAMMDPPRPEVAEAIQTCRQAGIRMVMITGDYGLTAASLARRVGLLNSSNPLIITGADLEKMDDLALESLLVKEIIFARMAPEHKLRLVAALQARGEVVAVTGDGVNDAPALRKADIGVAMGIAGTDVAREAADIILTNDNFAMIAAAIQEGRGVYENIRKFITYILASNVPEILPFILTSLFNIPLALRVRQILAIDLGTDLLPALALGMEKPEPDLMHRPPRRKTQPLIDRSLLGRALLWLGPIEALLCYLGFFFFSRWIDLPFWSQVPGVAQLKNGVQPANQYSFAVTIFYAGVVMAQIGNAFACRTERNRGRWLGWLSNPQLLIGIAAELAILFSQVYVPGVARWFGHVPLPAVAWMGLGLFPIILYSLDWLWKALRRRLTPAGGAFQEERQ